MGEAIDKFLDEMTRAIVREIDPETIVLFGSHARGTGSRDSDVDLLIVVDGEPGGQESRHEQEIRLYRALAHLRPPQDIIIASSEEVEQWRGDLNHVIARAIREGKVIYEKAAARFGSS
jgi:predicted nucleotidyltransferase